MAKEKRSYLCNQCQCISPVHLGKCPECHAWNSFEEQVSAPVSNGATISRQSLFNNGSSSSSPLFSFAGQAISAIPLETVSIESEVRLSSGFSELDRVLGGGILPGSFTLFGGDPGIGKSTLMLQVADRQSLLGKRVLYIAGEESPSQIKHRAERLKLNTTNIMVLPETRLIPVVQEIQRLQPDLIIVDSVQSMEDPAISSPPGSVSQIKATANVFMEVSKGLNIPVFLIGHVLKDGGLSGPKVLEHMVDTVLFFEGDASKSLRMLRTFKNRFGGTHEVGVFEMREDGLAEILNPSQCFLAHHMEEYPPGSIVLSTMQGTRPMLVEVQALVSQSVFSNPRRVANGIELARLHQILAILEKRLGFHFSSHDVYTNVVGGIDVQEPAADLAVALALITSHRNVPSQTGLVVAGEIGLTGELRDIPRPFDRLKEAELLGFRKVILPKPSSSKAVLPPTKLEVSFASTLMDAIRASLPANSPMFSTKPAASSASDDREITSRETGGLQHEELQ
jgi:DNA repair protein RadA/Sms